MGGLRFGGILGMKWSERCGTWAGMSGCQNFLMGVGWMPANIWLIIGTVFDMHIEAQRNDEPLVSWQIRMIWIGYEL